jgi:putative NADPH-quinone reductase
MLRRCSISDDDWPALSSKILDADVLVFATPVYFHHVPAPMKAMLDRFRSFIHVQITETGLQHTPWHSWNKDFVLILCMGSSDAVDADPVIDLFRFMTSILGENNRLHIITATRLAVVKQVIKSEEELRALYKKMSLSPKLASGDFARNQELLKTCRGLGAKINKKST